MSDLKILGRNPVAEALASEAPVQKIFLAKGSGGAKIDDLIRVAERKRIRLQFLPRPELDRLAKSNKHQGVVAVMPNVEYVDGEEIIEKAKQLESGVTPAILLLDGVEDPRNLGAILRVADCAGMQGVVITKRRCAEVTAAALKTSAGAAFHIPIAQVTNLATFIAQLKESGFWIVGLDSKAEKPIYQLDASMPIALVLGGEGKGLHRLVREKCDFLFKIPIKGQVESLNVSTAAAVVCYEVVRQKG